MENWLLYVAGAVVAVAVGALVVAFRKKKKGRSNGPDDIYPVW